MDGKKLLHDKYDFDDPFNAGQMVGMLVILTFIEINNGISAKILRQLKMSSADSLQQYFDKPSEDILLMIDNIVNEKREP